MTQEEKLQEAKRLYKTANSDQRYVLESLFPELKESEDERIRKELIDFFSDKDESDYEGLHPRTEIVAWLEKQGEQKPNPCENCSIATNNCQNFPCAIRNGEQKSDKVEPKFKIGEWIVYYRNDSSREILYVYDIRDGRYYFNDNIHLSWSVKECNEKCHLWTIQDAKDGDVLACNEEITLFKSYSVQGRISLYCWYNGQTNNFHSIEVDDALLTTRNKIWPATKEQRDLLFQKMKKAGYEWDAEKKELNKIVIPIFNIGDTIIKKNNSDINKFGQFTITDITGGKYWYNDRIICDIREQYEWELVEQKPISFDTSTPVSYDDIPFGEKDYELHEATYFIPEGFHAKIEGDKVIIKRGEQKPADLPKGEDYGIDGLYHAISILERTYGKVDGYQSDDGILEHECAISAVKKLYEKKPAWSEEDEKHIDSLLERLEGMCKKGATFTKTRFAISQDMDWLKSLKERIGG